jgi:arsenate reductase
MRERVHHVLFLCTGNSARSILAEALLNAHGGGRFRGYSAGSHPRGAVRPEALVVLERAGLPTAGLRSKSWEEFAAPGAPRLDLVFTVCDKAAGEACPIWPGKPVTAHWGIEDPAAVTGSAAEVQVAFARSLDELRKRIDMLLSLPIASLDRMTLQRRLQAVGAQESNPTPRVA